MNDSLASAMSASGVPVALSLMAALTPCAALQAMPRVPSLTSAVMAVPLPATAGMVRDTFVSQSRLRPSWDDFFAVDAARLGTLPIGWHGPGTGPVDNVMLARAREFIRQALDGTRDTEAPFVVPGADGSIQIEWHEKHGELEFAVEGDGGLWAWARDHRSATEFEGTGEEALAIFYRWAPWLAARRSDAADVPLQATTTFFGVAA